MWLAYSTKEDLWVSRVQVPVRGSVSGPVSDNFDGLDVGGQITDWNIRRGQWAPVGIVAFPGADNKSLQLEDRDPYDYAKAERVFAEGATKSISCKVYAHQNSTGQLNVEVIDHGGHRAVRLVFGADGHVHATDGANAVDAGPYEANRWYTVSITVNAADGKYDASLDGNSIVRQAAFMEPASNVNRLCFRTGDVYTEPTRKVSRDFGGRDVENAGEPVPLAAYNIDDVSVN